MNKLSAREARNHFSELIDNAQHEPITIERHGRSVAVVISAREYEQIKRERLRARLAIGEAQLDSGQGEKQTAARVIAEHKARSKDG